MNPKLSVVSIAFRLNARLKGNASPYDLNRFLPKSQLPFGGMLDGKYHRLIDWEVAGVRGSQLPFGGMLDGKLLAVNPTTLRRYRGSQLPFGGMLDGKVVVSGYLDMSKPYRSQLPFGGMLDGKLAQAEARAKQAWG